MLLTQEDDSPLKAIDFGLAVFFDPEKLPRTDLGLEGTPWWVGGCGEGGVGGGGQGTGVCMFRGSRPQAAVGVTRQGC
jgi:hypothetical protein